MKPSRKRKSDADIGNESKRLNLSDEDVEQKHEEEKNLSELSDLSDEMMLYGANLERKYYEEKCQVSAKIDQLNEGDKVRTLQENRGTQPSNEDEQMDETIPSLSPWSQIENVKKKWSL